MFTVMFAIGRLPGWIAQWKEMRENKEPIGDQGKYILDRCETLK
jgi:citrate synthase